MTTRRDIGRQIAGRTAHAPAADDRREVNPWEPLRGKAMEIARRIRMEQQTARKEASTGRGHRSPAPMVR